MAASVMMAIRFVGAWPTEEKPGWITLRVNGEDTSLPFMRTESLVFGPDLPALNELWFGPLSEDLISRLGAARQLHVSIPAGRNGSIVYGVSEHAFAQIEDVIDGGRD
jgi:hypothetical protein